MNGYLQKINYQIVHTSPGRIRINAPQLKNDWVCADQLEKLLNALDFVVRVRFNLLASSIAIRYQATDISEQAVWEQIAACFQQAVTINNYQDNQKLIKASDPKAEENLPSQIGGELVGEIFGELVGGGIGELLLGPIGEHIASGVMGKAGGLIGESVSHEIADVIGLMNHLEYQATKQGKPEIKQGLDKLKKKLVALPPVTGLTASQLANLWQIPSSTITLQADKGALDFESWSQENYGIKWSFLLSNLANPKSEKLFFPCS